MASPPAAIGEIVGMGHVCRKLAKISQMHPDDDPLIAAYLERRASVVRFLAARAGSPAAAEDMAQELYLKLASRDRSVEADNPVALLYRIATNVMLDRVRGDQRAAQRDAAWRRDTSMSLGGEDIADVPAADDALASRERLRQLVDAVADLPPQMQRAFRLHKLDGFSHAQTAQTMGISVKSVEKHISAALKVLTARLGR
jgi:RNA polymerase sigma factor (sigma-70 family)